MIQKIRHNFIWLILAALAVAAIFLWLAIFSRAPAGQIKVSFFDVGQGSAIFLAAPGGNQVLIDGGPSDIVLSRLGRAMPLFDKKIELLILTHPDSDHLSGLIEALKRYDVGQILETGIVDSSVEYRAWQEVIKQKNIPVIFARAGQVISVADNLAIKILYPLRQIKGSDFHQNTNASSIVGKISYGQSDILFTGDAEEVAEKSMLLFGANLAAEILAVGHHGSKTSTSPEFLAAVAPQAAVIQVGVKNRYGHPAGETLEKLKNINIFRTDLMGDINFLCDLNKCWFGQ